jgi:hypothetical protein
MTFRHSGVLIHSKPNLPPIDLSHTYLKFIGIAYVSTYRIWIYIYNLSNCHKLACSRCMSNEQRSFFLQENPSILLKAHQIFQKIRIFFFIIIIIQLAQTLRNLLKSEYMYLQYIVKREKFYRFF